MANHTVLLTITDTRSVADIKAQDFPVDSGSPHKFLNRVDRYLGGLMQKHQRASIACQVQNGDGVQGSCTITAASITAADTVTLCGVVLTAHASTQDGTHFVVGVSNTADAAALATCIGANTTLNKFLTASAASGVCTVKASTAGVYGKGYTASSSNGTRLAVSASPFANAADDTATSTTYHYGV